MNVNKQLSGIFDNILEKYNKPKTNTIANTTLGSNITRKPEYTLEEPKVHFDNQLLIHYITTKNKLKHYEYIQKNKEYVEFVKLKNTILCQYSWIYTYIVKNISTTIDEISKQTENNNNSIVIFKHYERLIDLTTQTITNELLNTIVINDLKNKIVNLLGESFDIILYDNLKNMKHKTFIVLKW